MAFDLDDPRLLLRSDVVDDPGPLYDWLRSESPVWRIRGQDTFLVSDPSLIREAVRRTDDFSSNLVSVLHDDGAGCPVAYAMAPFGDPIHVLATADPPLHARHRRLLQTHLSPANVSAHEPAILRIVDDHLDLLLESSPVDFVAVFGDPVPARTICEVIGLPQSDAPRIVTNVSGVGALLDGVTRAEGMGPAAHAAMELIVYVQQQLDATLGRPVGERSGLLAVFAEGVESGTITADEARDILLVLVSAGSETTASLLATAVETLAREPDLQHRLRKAPECIPRAIEDILRTDGPFQFHFRATPHDTLLGGTPIPAHSRVLLMWAAANRPSPDGSVDPPDPSEGRGPAPHFAFGKGLHFCIGAPIARLEARVALERLLARTTSITFDTERPPMRRPSIFIRRHASLPIVVLPA